MLPTAVDAGKFYDYSSVFSDTVQEGLHLFYCYPKICIFIYFHGFMPFYV